MTTRSLGCVIKCIFSASSSFYSCIIIIIVICLNFMVTITRQQATWRHLRARDHQANRSANVISLVNSSWFSWHHTVWCTANTTQCSCSRPVFRQADTWTKRFFFLQFLLLRRFNDFVEKQSRHINIPCLSQIQVSELTLLTESHARSTHSYRQNNTCDECVYLNGSHIHTHVSSTRTNADMRMNRTHNIYIYRLSVAATQYTHSS